ncbi:MAG: hypothetical protein QOH49_5003 [Acidobacteriota bacterium]|jgi:hypothetical protein|nr:hypothetical protein [Acidobacteriota bacterium]
MSDARPKCFVIMPFKAELHYFYLYLKHHIEQNHHVDCERGDAQVLTVPLLDKINGYIWKADVIIADCSDRNPNVFYELGIAHAHDKKVILITKDPINDAPTDIKQFEFIPYRLDNHTEFLERLDNALRNVFINRYEEWYDRAVAIFKGFRKETHAGVEMASKELFIQRLAVAEQRRELPSIEDELGVIELVLPRIIADSADVEVMSSITEWLATQPETKPKRAAGKRKR